jgi:hypothetical protein
MEKPVLTKRELFAAMILQGLSANNKLNDQTFDESAVMAVNIADELIRKKARQH